MAQGLNFHRNTFLEKEELNVFQSLLKKSSFINVLAIASESYGIISDEKPSNKHFVTTAGANAGTVDISGGLMLDPNFDLIEASDLKNIPIAADSAWYWGKFAYQKVNHENCLLSIDANGKVTISSGTINFLEKLRGATTKVPVYVRFVRSDSGTLLNDNVYEVSSVEETYFNLSTYFDFYAESNLRMIVLGSIPLGENFSAEQLEGLYSYNSYTLTFVPEVTAGVAPTKNAGEYYVNRVMNNGSTVTIQDKRSEYWSLNQNSDEIAALQAQDIVLENKIFYDYIVDSDATLAGLINNPNAHTVLIKNGTWNYNYGFSEENVITLHSNTKIIHCQPDAILNITGDVTLREEDALQSIIAYSPTTIGDKTLEINGLRVRLTTTGIPTGTSNIVTTVFSGLSNMINCKAEYVKCSNIIKTYGFYLCSQLKNCLASSENGIYIAYEQCEYLSNCKVTVDTPTVSGMIASQYGFDDCDYLDNCIVRGISATSFNAFRDSRILNSCNVNLINKSTVIGFNGCSRLVNCEGTIDGLESFAGSRQIFASCVQVVGCRIFSNQVHTANSVGFKSCSMVGHCRSINYDGIIFGGTSYENSQASKTSNTQYNCADTPAGGFNE